LQSRTQREVAHLWIQTRRTNFQVCEAISYDLFKNNAQIKTNPTKIEKQKVAGFSFGTDLKSGDSVCVYKFVAMLNSLNHNYKELTVRACTKALLAKSTGWNELFEENSQAWMQKWEALKPEVIREEFVKMQPFIG
jgi:maltose phosphorylase